MSPDPPTRFASIAIAGRPNVGKSALLNALVGEKLAIISAKPQSSRQPVYGVNTEQEVQVAFVDLPGLLDPDYLLQDAMMDAAADVLRTVHAVLYLHPAPDGPPPPLAELMPPDVSPGPRPVATVLSKADLLDQPTDIDVAPPSFLVSAATGAGMPELLAWCRQQALPGPFRSDPEHISTQPLRFFVEELVRETAFDILEQELPYALAAQVDEFREGSTPVYIRVNLYVERESQKGMVIGKGGDTIKRLGSQARARIETLLGERVYLDLWTKVLPKWRTRAHALRTLGFDVSTDTKGRR